ncbi:MAG: hypothetical protein HQK64_10525 [Desulfamplus sp.]|nr:hypothetical protein [Desulfamplus sp.]MBF0389803.1 hypothetical protein [Desulfamplus sp.]
MQFVVLGYDGTDEKALEKRMAVREAHLKMASDMYEQGKWLYAAAILNDAGNMCGSMIVCQFDSIEALKSEWLDSEPYMVGKVWEKVEIKQAKVAPFCAKG